MRDTGYHSNPDDLLMDALVDIGSLYNLMQFIHKKICVFPLLKLFQRQLLHWQLSNVFKEFYLLLLRVFFSRQEDRNWLNQKENSSLSIFVSIYSLAAKRCCRTATEPYISPAVFSFYVAVQESQRLI